MANYFIFGIGGTGSRVIRSLTMLLAAGYQPFKSGDRVFPILIDYDTTNGDTLRTTRIIDCYHTIHEAAYPKEINNEENFNNLFFSTPILKMSEVGEASKSGFTMQFGTESRQTFYEWTGMEQLRDGKSHTADLMNSLYDDSRDDSTCELRLKMDVGFKGNPNIGSIVFHSLKDTPEFQDFCSICGDSDKVIIVGSLFGGTGSSGIPELVQAIRGESRPAVKNVDLSVIMVCPYFGFRAADEKAVRSSIFNSKTKAALNFYELSGINNLINSIYYVGDDHTSIYEYCEGGENQKNCIHFVDLVSALSVSHFAENEQNKVDATTGQIIGGPKQFKYRFIEPDAAEVEEGDGENLGTDALNYTNLIDSELDHVFLPLASFALGLRFFHDEIANDSKIVNHLDWYSTFNLKNCFSNGKPLTAKTGDKNFDDLRTCCDGLMQFYDLFVLWNNEFKEHSAHPLYLFNFEGELHKFIVGGNLRVQSAGFLGLQNNKDYLKAEDDVAQATNKAYNTLKTLEAFRLDSKYHAFMLMLSLSKGCYDVFFNTKDRSADRRKILGGRMLKVEKDGANHQ